jgi:hypothetical protein
METESAAMEDPGVNGRNVVSWVASGIVLWSTAFLLVRALFPKRSYDFCNRAVSTMHAVAAVCLACLSVDDWSCPVCPLAAASSPRQVYGFFFLFRTYIITRRANVRTYAHAGVPDALASAFLLNERLAGGHNHHRRSLTLMTSR